jgi:hypothetical protein
MDEALTEGDVGLPGLDSDGPDGSGIWRICEMDSSDVTIMMVFLKEKIVSGFLRCCSLICL